MTSTTTQSQLTTLVSEGSLQGIQISSSMASKPGSTPGFYNPKRRMGRDVTVLSVAQWLTDESIKNQRRALAVSLPAPTDESNLTRPTKVQRCALVDASVSSTSSSQTPSSENNKKIRPARLLDTTCATGIQGLRNIVESPILAEVALDNLSKTLSKDDCETSVTPELHVILNDLDENAVQLTKQNANSTLQQQQQINDSNIHVTQRAAQSLLHEETFEVSVLDPFGSVQPFLDAALAKSPNGGLIEVCATDVGVLYGARPSIAKRHYHVQLAKKRPPCYRERGVRVLLAAIAQAAGRYDRGIVPMYGISMEHYCLVSVKVVRGAKAADLTARSVQPVRICRVCGDSQIIDEGAENKIKNSCNCGCDPINLQQEGPLWIGPLHDVEFVKGMANIANLDEAQGFISKKTRTFLDQLKEEAAINHMFHRRPGVAAKARTPKLTKVLEELQHRGYKASRTHFCVKSLKSDASAEEFDDAVMAILDKQDKA